MIDSIAANYRAEKTSTSSATSGKGSRAETLADRNAQLIALGAQLRRLAREHDCAIVVANQVSDRFVNPAASSLPVGGTPRSSAGAGQSSSSPAAGMMLPPSQVGFAPSGTSAPPPPQVLSLDHQLRWFSGWGDDPASLLGGLGADEGRGEKNPAMGLTWANQIDCRIAVLKEERLSSSEAGTAAEWAPRRWRRFMRCVFSSWAEPSGERDRGVEFEVWAGGVKAVSKKAAGTLEPVDKS